MKCMVIFFSTEQSYRAGIAKKSFNQKIFLVMLHRQQKNRKELIFFVKFVSYLNQNVSKSTKILMNKLMHPPQQKLFLS